MKTFDFTIGDPEGMHARPAGVLAKQAKQYESKVTIKYKDMAIDAGRMMAIMGLGVKQGGTITVEVSGPDEDKAAAELEAFLKENLS